MATSRNNHHTISYIVCANVYACIFLFGSNNIMIIPVKRVRVWLCVCVKQNRSMKMKIQKRNHCFVSLFKTEKNVLCTKSCIYSKSSSTSLFTIQCMRVSYNSLAIAVYLLYHTYSYSLASIV